MSTDIDAIVIGASAGAVETLSSILPVLPQQYELPIFIVVHIPPDRRSILASLLQEKCKIPVREAEDKEPIETGTVYFAPPDYHMMVNTGRYISLSAEEPVLFSRPSIDVLFETAADIYRERLAGIILTGANEDGAGGLKTIAAKGGTAIALDPKEAVVPTMPEAALKSCPTAQKMSLEQIKEFIRKGART